MRALHRHAAACAVLVHAITRAAVASAQPAAAFAVPVHLDAPAGTPLRGRASASDAWSVVCVAPCDARLDPTWAYALEGGGDVTLAGGPPGAGARVVAKPAPSPTLGRALIVSGAATYVVGDALTVAWVVGLALHATGRPLQPWVTPMGYASSAVTAVGLTLLVAGAIRELTRGKGRVDVVWQPAPPPAPAATPTGAPFAPLAVERGGSAFTLPLVSGVL